MWQDVTRVSLVSYPRSASQRHVKLCFRQILNFICVLYPNKIKWRHIWEGCVSVPKHIDRFIWNLVLGIYTKTCRANLSLFLTGRLFPFILYMKPKLKFINDCTHYLPYMKARISVYLSDISKRNSLQYRESVHTKI